MSEVSNSDIMTVLLSVREDIGGIKANLVSHAAAFNAHVKDDQKIVADVQALQISAAKASGRRTAYATIGAFVGSAAALIVDYFRR